MRPRKAGPQESERRTQHELDQEAARERLGATVDARLRRILQFLEKPFRARPSGERLDWRVELGVFSDARMAKSDLKAHVGLLVGDPAAVNSRVFDTVTEAEAAEVYRVLSDRFERFKNGEPWPMPQRQGLTLHRNPDTGLVMILRGSDAPRDLIGAIVVEIGRLLSQCRRLHVCLTCQQFFVAVRQARRHKSCKQKVTNQKRKKGS